MSAARIRTPDDADMTAEQAMVRDRIAAGPRGTVPAPLGVWLHNARLADLCQELGAFCRYGTSLPPRLSELAILVVGSHWKAGYEWAVHAPIAAEAGVPADVIEALRVGKVPDFDRADEAALYAFASSLLSTHRVPDDVYDRARELLGDRTVVELVGLLGYYGLISMTITAFELDLPPGAANPFPSADAPHDSFSLAEGAGA